MGVKNERELSPSPNELRKEIPELSLYKCTDSEISDLYYCYVNQHVKFDYSKSITANFREWLTTTPIEREIRNLRKK